MTAAAIVVAGLFAGFGTWLGAESQGVHLALTTMLGAGLNVVPTALVALGFGAVVLPIAPRAASRSVYGAVAWSLLADVLASMVSRLKPLGRLSLFHYMALAPAQHVAATALLVTIAVAVALCAAALVLFRKRDLV